MRRVLQIGAAGCGVYGVYVFVQAVQAAVASRWPDAYGAAIEMVIVFAGVALLWALGEASHRRTIRRSVDPPARRR